MHILSQNEECSTNITIQSRSVKEPIAEDHTFYDSIQTKHPAEGTLETQKWTDRGAGDTQWGHVGRRKEILFGKVNVAQVVTLAACTCEKFKSHQNVCFQQVSHAVPELAGRGACL